MDHNRLVDKLLNEIADARAGITTNYNRLWRERRCMQTHHQPT